MKRIPGEELRFAARRALAFGHAALESGALTQVREAQRAVLNVLALVDEKVCGGDIRQLVEALRSMSVTLGGVHAEVA